MKWIKQEDGIVHPGFVYARVSQNPFGWVANVGVRKSQSINDSEQDAKQWAEARMNELKKEFIKSLIVKYSEDTYTFGGLLEIVGGYDGIDKWSVYQTSFKLFEGTLEECKNYIASCF
jgi:hypothetical protein